MKNINQIIEEILLQKYNIPTQGLEKEELYRLMEFVRESKYFFNELIGLKHYFVEKKQNRERFRQYFVELIEEMEKFEKKYHISSNMCDKNIDE
jgi:hypothetical protein